MEVFPISAGKAAWQSTISPAWTTVEQITASGRRRALSTQLYPKWTLSAKFQGLTNAEAETLLGFWNARRGTFESFYYKDFTHYKAEGQRLAQNPDGSYQCVSIIGGYTEPVNKVDNLHVYVNGVETTSYTEADGRIRLSATGIVTADYEYYFRVHFASSISVTEKFYDFNEVSIKLEVVR